MSRIKRLKGIARPLPSIAINCPRTRLSHVAESIFHTVVISLPHKPTCMHSELSFLGTILVPLQLAVRLLVEPVAAVSVSTDAT